MKCIILILLISLSLSAQKLTFTGVVEVDSISQDDLYKRGLIWFAKAFVSPNDVIQIKDQEQGLIMAKAYTTYSPTRITQASAEGKVSYNFSIYFKEGRYKYVVTDFYYEPYKQGSGFMKPAILTEDKDCPDPVPMAVNWSNRVWADIKAQVRSDMKTLVVSMANGMKVPLESASDW